MRKPRVPAQTRADQKLFAIWFVKTICYLVQRKLFAISPASRCWAHRHSQPAAFAWTGVLVIVNGSWVLAGVRYIDRRRNLAFCAT